MVTTHKSIDAALPSLDSFFTRLAPGAPLPGQLQQVQAGAGAGAAPALMAAPPPAAAAAPPAPVLHADSPAPEWAIMDEMQRTAPGPK